MAAGNETKKEALGTVGWGHRAERRTLLHASWRRQISSRSTLAACTFSFNNAGALHHEEDEWDHIENHDQIDWLMAGGLLSMSSDVLSIYDALCSLLSFFFYKTIERHNISFM